MDRGGGIDGVHVVGLGELSVHFDESSLVYDERVLLAARKIHVHAGFVIVEKSLLTGFPVKPLKQSLNREVEVEGLGRDEGEVKNIGDPVRGDSSEDGTAEDGIDILFGDDQLPRLQCGNDLVFEPVNKIGRIEKAEGYRIKIVLLLEVGDGFPDEFNGIAG